MDKAQLRKLTGQDSGGRTASYKLNQVIMSGDNGTFKLKQFLSEKGEDGRYPAEELGKEVSGVILKMRWALSRFEEAPKQSLKSSEYDNKHTDDVTVYPIKDRGPVTAMKEKHGLATQRIVYFYLPSKQQIVRLVVKSSALTGDKNSNGEKGLFEYVDEYNASGAALHEFITTCTGVHRADPNGNKRKDYMAMTFKAGRQLSESELANIEQMIVEVHEKTNTVHTEEREVGISAPQQSEMSEDGLDAIPF